MSALLIDQVPVPVPPRLRLVHDADAIPRRRTSRGRFVVRVISAVIAVLLAVALGAAAGLALRPTPAVGTGVVTVEAGDSLWSLAAGLAGPGRDVRDVVAEIVRLNGLATDFVVPGQRLVIPGR